MRYVFSLLITLVLLAPSVNATPSSTSPDYPGELISVVEDLKSFDVATKTKN